MQSMEHFFATCPRGLEPQLAEDLVAAGASQVSPLPGGAHFAGDWGVCYHANLHSRIASRILWRVAQGNYTREDDVYRLALDTPWPQWFTASQTLRVDVTAIRSPLRSLDFITLRVKDAICDRFRREVNLRPSIDTREPDVRVQIFLTAEACTLYIDTSGDPLWQRGYRQKTVDAPLKENLAAGLLRLTGWQPGSTLYDPMCGSGTFLAEAAQVALGKAPGSKRSFAFEKFRHFESSRWQALLTAARANERPAAFAGIYGSDQSAQATRSALANLDRAGLLPAVRLSTHDILDAEPPESSGILLCNPPYGVRLEEQDSLASFYPLLGRTLKQYYAGWLCHFFTGDLRLPKLIGLKPERRTPLFNGALECRLFAIRMVAGSNRKERHADAPDTEK